MKFDVVFVTYNSSKWIDGNIKSILNSKYDLKNISLYFFDNNSSDNTVKSLSEYQKKYSDKFNSFTIIEGKKNYGFGVGNNKAAKLGKSKYIFFLNIDTEINPDTFSKLEKEISVSESDVGIFELRQYPYEHPKYYNPVNGETSWASGACMIIKRDIFKKIRGFDKNIFMYCEDVEISWRVRSLGYRIKYLFNVPITHYSYSEANEFKKLQFINACSNVMYLRCKYGTIRNVLGGCKLWFDSLRFNLASTHITNDEYKVLRKELIKNYIKVMFKGIGARIYKHTHKFVNEEAFDFSRGFDYSIAKLDPFYILKSTKETKKVSIIVRTCGRPNVLRETLISLRNQMYKNIEVVVVEDGKNTSEKMIKEEFGDLNIIYKSTGEKVGRCKAGNLGLSLATGDYFNFLDDDDVFYPDHVKVLVDSINENKCDIVCSTAFDTSIIVKSTDPYLYDICNIGLPKLRGFSRFDLYRNNVTPIQAVMFSRKVYETCGGFDENMDALEDWELWIRYSLKFNFNYVRKTTSIYRIPYNNQVSFDRQKFLNSAVEYVINKHKDDKVNITIADVFYGDVFDEENK